MQVPALPAAEPIHRATKRTDSSTQTVSQRPRSPYSPAPPLTLAPNSICAPSTPQAGPCAALCESLHGLQGLPLPLLPRAPTPERCAAQATHRFRHLPAREQQPGHCAWHVHAALLAEWLGRRIIPVAATLHSSAPPPADRHVGAAAPPRLQAPHSLRTCSCLEDSQQ